MPGGPEVLMDQVVPVGVAFEEAEGIAKRRRGASRRVVVGGKVRLSVVALYDWGFVIEAEEPPRLRGFVDILDGDNRIARSLVMLVWARDGLAAYEFKRRSLDRLVATDYAPGREGDDPADAVSG